MSADGTSRGVTDCPSCHRPLRYVATFEFGNGEQQGDEWHVALQLTAISTEHRCPRPTTQLPIAA